MKNQVLVETSARHVHLSQKDLDTLFGEGYQLTNKKDLSQPGQFACTERVDVVGSKKTLAGVTILGPVRPDTQVELSLTDARSIGVDAPIRESGDIAGSGVCKLVGPKGEVELTQGVIAAKRHIHMTPQDAEEFGVSERIIGLTVVAIGTSLPELVTSVVAAAKGETDIAVGNIIGSNIFNIFFVAGVSSFFYPLTFTAGGNLVDACVALGAALLLYALSALKGHKLNKIGGAVMLLCFAGYYTYLFLI